MVSARLTNQSRCNAACNGSSEARSPSGPNTSMANSPNERRQLDHAYLLMLAARTSAFSPEVRDQLEAGIRRVAEGVAAAHGVTVAVSYRRGYPPTVNTSAEAAFCASVGRELLGALVQWARATGTKVVPLCPFAKAQFDKDASIRDVLV